MPPSKAASTFEGLERILKGYLMDQGLDEVWQLALIHKYWLLVVEHNFALKTRPYSLHSGVLTILVPDSAYAQVLRLKYKRVLIEQLGMLDDPIQLRDVRFKIGKVEALPGSSLERKEALSRELERMKKGEASSLSPARVAELFASKAEDFIEEVLPDGQKVKRHKEDLHHRKRRPDPPPKAAQKAGEAAAEGIQDERLRKAFAKARARAIEKKGD